MTCYDLRFPELARALVDRGARAARRPGGVGRRASARSTTGARCVRARAIENTVFVAAAGQPGPRYSGHSMVVDPLGDVLAEAGEEATTLRVDLDRGLLDRARRTNPSLANRRL